MKLVHKNMVERLFKEVSILKDGKFVFSDSEDYGYGPVLSDTKEEAIKEAKDSGLTGCIYIGVVENFDKKVGLGAQAIETLEEHIFDECGVECNISVEKIKELDELLWQTFSKWLRKNKEFPDHYKVVDIEKVYI